uniref:Uncharacterized protein n=1 Tax=Cryptomonas curvata TaxID=233186 RepID=A0A7S0QRG4_9CRYP|mmetsp:Transcript_46570/g.97442  ORF Transcript_46570/g.97442 Transcript_46570/m.97442 type:complete len:193 (+) Transcript_46570:210-788(+)
MPQQPTALLDTIFVHLSLAYFMHLLIKAVKILIHTRGFSLRNLTNWNQPRDVLHQNAAKTDSDTPSQAAASRHSTANHPMPSAFPLQRPAFRLQLKAPIASPSQLSESATAHHSECSAHPPWSPARPSNEPWDDDAALETPDAALLKQAFRDMVRRRRKCSRAWLRERLVESGVGGLRPPPRTSFLGLRWPF